MPHRAEQPDSVDGARPEWFAAFLADRGTRKPSAHTLKAYRQDFDAIAALIAGGEDLSGMALDAITIDTLRTAFAQYAETHEAASIQRCWSTWNVLCTYLFTAELIASNPMPMVGRPKLAKTLPKALAADAVAALLTALSADPSPRRRTDWMQRDRALILTALLAGLRADELVRATSVTFAAPTTAPSSTSAARAAKTAGSPSSRHWSTSSSAISTPGPPACPPRPNGAPPPAGDWPPGRRRRRYLSAPTVSASPAAPCNTGCCGRFAAPASTPTAPAALLSTGCATPSPPSWPTPMSASTP